MNLMRVGIIFLLILANNFSRRYVCMFTKKEFCLTDEEYNTIEKWVDTHECNCKHGEQRSASCCGGEISIIFTPSAVGTFITVKCICGKEKAVDMYRNK